MNETVVVVTGAAPLDPTAVAQLPADGLVVIAADGGLDHALGAGLVPSTLVGDLDSVSDEGRAWAEQHATIERHDPAKDATDTELALARAASLAPDRLIMIAGAGDRLDHTLTAIGALGAPSLTSIPVIECWWGDQHLSVLHGPGRLRLATVPGATVSLVATHGRCTGVSIGGTEWPLDDADLAPLSGHGVSNVAVGDAVEVSVSSGVLTIFSQPSATEPLQASKELP
jgi:thiamine pyrophosphokinase